MTASTTREGFWSVQYRGRPGEGFGIMVLDTGMVVGADSFGGIWDGSYKFNADTRRLDITLTVHLPPDVYSAVTGRGSADGFTETYNFALSREMHEEVVHNVDTGLGPLRVVFRKIRDFP